MGKVYFTDSCSNLTIDQAKEMGANMVRYCYIPRDTCEPCFDGDGVIADEHNMTSAALGPDAWKEIFEPYIGSEIVFVMCNVGTSSVLRNLKTANIPGLTLIESGLMGIGTVEVLKRVMANKPYDDIRFFFAAKTQTPSGVAWDQTMSNYTLFEMSKEHDIVPIKSFLSKYVAILELKKHVNTKLVYGNVSNLLGLHHGRDYVSGLYIGMQPQKVYGDVLARIKEAIEFINSYHNKRSATLLRYLELQA